MLDRKRLTSPSVLGRLLLATILVCVRMAGAQATGSAGSAGTTQAADYTVADGDRLLRARDLDAALAVFRTVQAATPTAECQQRIASTLNELGRFGEAYSAYTALLDQFGNRLTPDERKQFDARLRALDAQTGLLLFDNLSNVATVRIDGISITRAALEKPLRVNRGMVELEIQQPGSLRKSLQLTVNAGVHHVDAAPVPQPATGSITVTGTTLTDATLFVDGRAIGVLPQRLELAPGGHEITAVGQRDEARPIRIQVEPGKSVTLGLNFVPRVASLDIDPVVPDAMLFVDNQPVGSGRRTLTLTPGQHELELQRGGFQTQRLSITVQPGQQQRLTAGPYIAAPGPTRTPTALTNPTQPLPQPGEAANTESPPKTPPLAAEPEASSPYTGIFGSFIVPVMLGGDSTHSYVDNCPAKAYGGACTTSSPRGGGLGLRLGYFYEWIGLELLGAGAVDVTTTELKLPPIPEISSAMQNIAGRNVFVRAGGILGIGARLAIPMQGLRLTVGADYLYVYRKVIAIPDSFAGASLSYSVPGWLIDGGIQLGSTPGARFYIGAFVLIEQAHDLPLNRNLTALGIDPALVPPELAQMTIYRGRQIFYGPLLGIAFGH